MARTTTGNLPAISEGGLSHYLSEIRKFPMLEPQQEFMLAKRWREHDDSAAIGNLAHTLKSSSASVGALALSALCAEIERSVRAGETASLAPMVENLLSEGEAALGAVRAMLRN